MYKNKIITVVVPAYNECEHILSVITKIPDFIDYVVVVDDCSTDQTVQILQPHLNKRLMLYRNEHNLGVGGAIMRGHIEALQLHSDIDVVMAGDDQMDPAYLSSLIDCIIDDGYQYSKGNRFIEKSNLIKMPKIRIFGSMILSILTKSASGYFHISDPQNGYTALDLNAFKKLKTSHIRKDYLFENDLLIHLNLINAKIKEVSMPARYNGEKSKLSINRFLLKATSFFIYRTFWRIWVKYVKT